MLERVTVQNAAACAPDTDARRVQPPQRSYSAR
jgi:hypothetical protein